MLVDDERALRERLGGLLRRAGYTVETAATSDEAFEKMCQAATEFDLLITDHLMPGMDGYDFVRQLRSRSFAGLIFVHSAFLDADLKAIYRVAGVTRIFVKPVPWEVLRDAIAELCRGGDSNP